jgi:signal transduction histidine kinase
MFVARPPDPRPRACRPADVLRACLDEFKAEAEARGIRLTSEFEASDQPTWMDPDAFRHLADVLIRNALQATTGGGKIQVRSAHQGQELRLSVADGGKGVSAAEGAHLFDPFFCGRQAGRGLGLGLPRAARMVELAGGSLTWSSAVGQGSAFHVQLPLRPLPVEPIGSAP